MPASSKQSAGLLMYRRREGPIEVLLVHPGGPYWARKDLGAWSIPKGAIEPGEEPLAAAHREFQEETGVTASGTPLPLGALRQPSGKTIHAWAVEGDCDAGAIRSESFEMEWPPRSGKIERFPEVDRGEWFPVPEGLLRIIPGQAGFLRALAQAAGAPMRPRRYGRS